MTCLQSLQFRQRGHFCPFLPSWRPGASLSGFLAYITLCFLPQMASNSAAPVAGNARPISIASSWSATASAFFIFICIFVWFLFIYFWNYDFIFFVFFFIFYYICFWFLFVLVFLLLPLCLRWALPLCLLWAPLWQQHPLLNALVHTLQKGHLRAPVRHERTNWNSKNRNSKHRSWLSQRLWLV